MRHTVVLWTLLAALLVAGGVALAATKQGTGGNNQLVGTNRADELYGKGGNDKLYGKGGNDVLHGGRNDDRLYDKDDPSEKDKFYCGTGRDTAYANPNDHVSGSCEVKKITREEPPPSSRDLLPDLGMKVPGDIHIENTSDGKHLLRFSTTIVNVGDGIFELYGQRDVAAQEMDVTQRIFSSSGDYHDRSTTAKMFYAGDGHTHWHVKDIEEYELLRSGDEVASGAKQGFCFFDNVEWFVRDASENPPPGVPATPQYDGCANGQPEALSVTVGLSRGWGDVYAADVVDQYIDVTELPDGPYRLRITADKPNWFLEKDETNNVTWADIKIEGDTVTVLGYSPSSPPIS